MRLEVDFEQLKIENDQLRDQLEEKNQALLKLKLSSGNTMQVLNSYKVQPQSQHHDDDFLCTDFFVLLSCTDG